MGVQHTRTAGIASVWGIPEVCRTGLCRSAGTMDVGSVSTTSPLIVSVLDDLDTRATHRGALA